MICYTNSFVRIVVFTFFLNYICATPMVWAYFWHLTAKLIFMSNFWEVDILNHKMRLSLYIVCQSNMIQCCRGFFYTVMYKKLFFFCFDSYFKSHNKNYIVCSLYHHAFHNSIFFVCIQLTSCEFCFFRGRCFVVRV